MSPAWVDIGVRQAVAGDAAVHCKKLQHNTTQCNAMQHNAARCIALKHIAQHAQRAAEEVVANMNPCNTLQHTATLCNTLRYTAKHCKTLQHNAPQYIKLQYLSLSRIHTLTGGEFRGREAWGNGVLVKQGGLARVLGTEAHPNSLTNPLNARTNSHGHVAPLRMIAKDDFHVLR